MLLAVSDLHVSHAENRAIVESFWPLTSDDCLLLAGDIAEQEADFTWVISTLSQRFSQVVWTPGNHELWCTPKDPLKLPGVLRYEHLVNICRQHKVLTPEDEFYRYCMGDGTAITIAPIFTLYDYSFRNSGDYTEDQAIERARRCGVMSSDEFFLKTYPHKNIIDWCRERIRYTEKRLNTIPDGENIVLMSHFPITRKPLESLRNTEFSIWCGSEKTHKWASRKGVRMVVYGHLHIPNIEYIQGIAHIEVSLGYPREWREHNRHSYLVKLDELLEYATEYQ
ncbi:metallophosphoesterase family protein [Xenorhabdus littoralis]|uniref:metallophosphoesterase family protein n=1 Tax=Xenorhabdus littoralis TaxID=2582835 RepID=UPI0029E7E2D6|nr:metallophosphoesterase [Xenorhabdus sp. psl]MDX7991062.1 metallophosphoesterase [Xenorhabdus sp. psl]